MNHQRAADFFRGSGDYRLGGEPPTPVCWYLIGANILVFVLQIFAVRHPRLEDYRQNLPEVPEAVRQTDGVPPMGFMRLSVVEEWLQLDTNKVVFGGQIWRLVTCAFCHDRFGVWHILINMLMLYWFGRSLEILYGSREFLLFYMTATVVASLAHVALGLLTHNSVPAIGASGPVLAVMMLYAMHFPRSRIYLFFILPIEIRWLLLLYVVFDLHPVLLALAGTPLVTGVAHAAHLGGLGFGYLYYRYQWRLEQLWPRRHRWNWSHWLGARRHVRLFREPSKPDEPQAAEVDHEALLDDVLRKLHTHGDLSLSDAERAVLREAAERYRQRRST